MWIISLVAIHLTAQDSQMCMQVLEAIVQMEIQLSDPKTFAFI